MGTGPVACHDYIQINGHVKSPQGEVECVTQNTHSDACLVPTPDTPPVNPRGREGPYLSVHATRQTMQDSLTYTGWEANYPASP